MTHWVTEKAIMILNHHDLRLSRPIEEHNAISLMVARSYLRCLVPFESKIYCIMFFNDPVIPRKKWTSPETMFFILLLMDTLTDTLTDTHTKIRKKKEKKKDPKKDPQKNLKKKKKKKRPPGGGQPTPPPPHPRQSWFIIMIQKSENISSRDYVQRNLKISRPETMSRKIWKYLVQRLCFSYYFWWTDRQTHWQTNAFHKFPAFGGN